MKKANLIFVLSIIYFTGCKHHESHEEEQSVLVVTNPIKSDTVFYHDYVCQIRAVQHIELRALEKGYLQNIYVDEGQYVKKGQILFQLMPLVYQAEKEKAQAEMSFAEIEYLNTKKLADSMIVSKNELALVKAKLEKSKAELSLAQAKLSFTEIRAPFDGIVGRFNDVRLGSLVDEGDILTTLSDNSKMWVYFNVPEAEYLAYATNDHEANPIMVKLRMANNDIFEQDGKVETIEADFNNKTGNIAFRATFENPQKVLRHGQTGNILMPIKLKSAMLIPQKATFEILDKTYVYVVDENDVIHSQPVEVGAELHHIYEITKGLSTKDKILIEGLRKVKNNQKISYKIEAMDHILKDLNHLHAE